MRAFSFGGGVQSTAALVLAVRGEIDFPVFLFANVGEDSENPDSLAYIAAHSRPYAEAHGIEFVELRRIRRNGQVETLMDRITGDTKSIPIPARMEGGAPGRRTCTRDFKVLVIAKETKRRGATEAVPATIGLGISTDEWQRASTNHRVLHQKVEYPLLDLRISRRDCLRIVAEAGLPEPPRSACFYCPFHKPSHFVRLKQEHPDLFAQAVKVEEIIRGRNDRVYLTRMGRTLDVLTPDQPSLWDDDACESGYCMV